MLVRFSSLRLLDNANYVTYSNERKVQRWALATLDHSLYGKERKVGDGWMTKDTGDLSEECTWHGVVCDDVSGGAVGNSIDMSGNNLRGIIPIEVSLLVNIGELNNMISFLSR